MYLCIPAAACTPASYFTSHANGHWMQLLKMNDSDFQHPVYPSVLCPYGAIPLGLEPSGYLSYSQPTCMCGSLSPATQQPVFPDPDPISPAYSCILSSQGLPALVNALPTRAPDPPVTMPTALPPKMLPAFQYDQSKRRSHQAVSKGASPAEQRLARETRDKIKPVLEAIKLLRRFTAANKARLRKGELEQVNKMFQNVEKYLEGKWNSRS
ncbi:hypothetical protein BGW36DRAFT_362949 [Talaromyces proteolyticus]|uniref:Uncharacterized protein n=1 Tax=Talaromyces proteolyticus TaxID=1131652 RepID=A0AAD4KMI4_9EURO|nr:uncharacterized protein BGW36DRAFT_362949 [Talaromyces proteolyticus]KAH8691922.1 hypothetical protein BGW36DRAFT_362949 [Talaromyces proteolyticus]